MSRCTTNKEAWQLLFDKYNILENGGIETALNTKPKNESKIMKLFKAIKRILLGKSSETEQNDL